MVYGITAKYVREAWCGTALLFLVWASHVGSAQVPRTRPVEGLRDYTPQAVAWVNAKIVVRPGKIIPRGTVLIRDSVIAEIGPDVELPPGTKVLDGSGKTLYAGWIDAYDAVELDDVPSAHPYWNRQVQPQRRAEQTVAVDESRHKALRKAGIAARLVVPKSGVIQGQSVLVATADEPLVIEPSPALHMRLTVRRGRGESDYPGSPMGAVALARQACYDAQWYQQAWKVFELDPRVGMPERNDALAAMQPYISGERLVVFDCPNERYVLRADRFAREFGLRAAMLGSGNEYRRLEAVIATGRPIIVPVAFPKAPDVGTPEAAREVPLQTLMHWDVAPENPARLQRAGATLAVTTWGTEPSEFLDRIREAVYRGWAPDHALAALTVNAARLLGADARLGTLEPGKLANILVMDGDWHRPETKIVETWVAGNRYEHQPRPEWDPRGRWEIRRSGATWTLDVTGTAERLKARLWLAPASRIPEDASVPSRGEDDSERGADAEAGEASTRDGVQPIKVREIKVADDRLAIVLDGKELGHAGTVRVSLVRLAKPSAPGDHMVGRLIDPRGRAVELTAKRLDAPDRQDKSNAAGESQERAKPAWMKRPRRAAFPVNYPLGAYGRSGPPEQPAWLLLRHATVWTCGKSGVLDDCDVLVQRGIIRRVGRNLPAPENAVIVDCRGKHLTPGIVDCHSHMATDGGVNEGTQAITAEVRIGDFINPDDIAIYQQLAGGVTSANILHGSANPIGGQNQVIKLRWGDLDEAMKFHEAPPGIKFALGENVKQSNWGDDYTTRYPQTRMGVEQIIRDAFEAAKRYELQWRQWKLTRRGLPPRKDLELEALVEILQRRRWIHCHSYRQDEILALLRTLEQYGVRIGTLQHILEGYKVADAMKRHGAMASSFSDWWAYKFEVYDAIPYNGALMHQVGIVVSFNSDDREMARHLNHEAAKAVKYGGVEPEEALKFVTLNPAKQLRIERWVGSIEPGKQADLVVWSGPPLSTLSKCEQTWIDGRKYFDLQADAKQRARFRSMKERLVQRVLQSGAEMLKPGESNPTRDELWPQDDEFCHCHPRASQ